MWIAGLAVLMFSLALLADVLEATYVKAVGDRKAHRAAITSVGMWAVGSLSLFVVIEVSWWLLPAEMLGLYCGTLLGMRSGRE